MYDPTVQALFLAAVVIGLAVCIVLALRAERRRRRIAREIPLHHRNAGHYLPPAPERAIPHGANSTRGLGGQGDIGG